MRIAVSVLLAILSLAGPAIPQVAAQKEAVELSAIKGQIVLFDWAGHGSKVNEN